MILSTRLVNINSWAFVELLLSNISSKSQNRFFFLSGFNSFVIWYRLDCGEKLSNFGSDQSINIKIYKCELEIFLIFLVFTKKSGLPSSFSIAVRWQHETFYWDTKREKTTNKTANIKQITNNNSKINYLVHYLLLQRESLCDAMRCDAMRCDAMRCNAMRCDAMRCDAMRCDAMQCNAMHCIAT